MKTLILLVLATTLPGHGIASHNLQLVLFPKSTIPTGHMDARFLFGSFLCANSFTPKLSWSVRFCGLMRSTMASDLSTFFFAR